MKITKTKLKQIIKEELELVLEKDVGEKVAQSAEKINNSEKGEQAIQQALKDPKVIKALEKLVSKLPKELTEEEGLKKGYWGTPDKTRSFYDMWQGDHAPEIGGSKSPHMGGENVFTELYEYVAAAGLGGLLATLGATALGATAAPAVGAAAVAGAGLAMLHHHLLDTARFGFVGDGTDKWKKEEESQDENNKNTT
jgi:hypothetical protein